MELLTKKLGSLNENEKVIRSFLKLLFLPCVVIFSLLMILTGYAFQFYYWIYEVKLTKLELEINQEMHNDFKKLFFDAFRFWK